MIEQLALGLIGFSVCAAVLLLLASFFVFAGTREEWISLWSGRVLLAGLALLQLAHWLALMHERNWVGSPGYVVLLFVVAPAFYLFFRGSLQLQSAMRTRHLAFYAPALAAAWIPAQVAIPLSFALGTLYALHLGKLVLQLRSQRRRFHIEMFALAVFALIALGILVLGIASPFYGPRAFVIGYSGMIGLAMMMAVHVLLHFPDIASKTAEAVSTAYAVSTLDRVDRAKALGDLRARMDDQVFADESLKLAGLAAMLDLTPHQLSELINTEFGIGYSRYIREHRVAAARRMLLEEPDASVLSIGLAVGFTSQSNFYAAFREITGEVPGRFRARNSANS